MARLRGEELPGFFDVLQSWLPHRPWFPTRTARWSLTRTGGLRLPTPEGDPDPRILLELHIFDVAHGEGEDRICVPLVLRSRPSALAGKNAFIGTLTDDTAGEIWLYDGARDRVFLAAWLEMVRRGQGTRNGRATAEPFGGFEAQDPFTVRLRRSSWDTDSSTRTLVTREPADDVGWDQRVVIDFLRRPEAGAADAFDTLEALTRARSTTVPSLLGRVTGAWKLSDTDDGGTIEQLPADRVRWEQGDLGLVRAGALAAPDAAALVADAAARGEDLTAEVREIGRTLGTFHSDLAAVFGAYPQTTAQQESRTQQTLADLDDAWSALRSALQDTAEEGLADLAGHMDRMRSRLAGDPAPLTIQTIHGDAGLAAFRHWGGDDGGWMIAEAGEPQPHALPLEDAVRVIQELTVLAEEHERAEAAELIAAFLEGLAHSDADVSWISSAVFAGAVVVSLLHLRREELIADTTVSSVLHSVNAPRGSVS